MLSHPCHHSLPARSDSHIPPPDPVSLASAPLRTLLRALLEPPGSHYGGTGSHALPSRLPTV